MALADFFAIKETEEGTHRWVLTAHDPAKSPEVLLATTLADRIVQHQCRGAPHLYEAWKAQANEGTMTAGNVNLALRAFLEPVFGPKGQPGAVSTDHLEGYVAEMLWYFLCLELSVEMVVRSEPPGFKSTDPGGDALIVHRMDGAMLMFRLWELKKYAPSSSGASTSAKPTVRRAFTQLDSKALEYLARYTAIGQELDEEELAEFYGKLVELWIDGSPQAAAGVSVATSECYVADDCFSEFGDYFPDFLVPNRLRGMLNSVADYSGFVREVQRQVWKGL